MSGGHFHYRQSAINEIADDIEELIETNHDKDEYGFSYDISDLQFDGKTYRANI